MRPPSLRLSPSLALPLSLFLIINALFRARRASPGTLIGPAEFADILRGERVGGGGGRGCVFDVTAERRYYYFVDLSTDNIDIARRPPAAGIYIGRRGGEPSVSGFAV